MPPKDNYTPLNRLQFGHADAGQYLNSPDMELFHRFYLAHPQIDKLTNSPCYFLVGEKGTGKTSIATYYSNWPSEKAVGHRVFIEKEDFRNLRTRLVADDASSIDYTEIWKTIFSILAFHIRVCSVKQRGIAVPSKSEHLLALIDRLSLGTFKPSTSSAFDLFAWDMEPLLSGMSDNKRDMSTAPLRTRLRFIQTQFLNAIPDPASTSTTDLLFVDGIDTRPFTDSAREDRIPHSEYLDCIRGLVSATWFINNNELRPRFGHALRIVLLIRPDIIDRVGLQNLNNIMSDNSLLLNWYSSSNYRNSHLFELADNILLQQQSIEKDHKYIIGNTWDHYFPYDTLNNNDSPVTSFEAVRRNTLHRPRDIIKLLDLSVSYECRVGNGEKSSVPTSTTWTKEVRTAYSEYLLGEVKEALSFYHESKDFELFVLFFQYLSNENEGQHKFSYKQYNAAYGKYKSFIDRNENSVSPLFSTADSFLQFLFELNVISYKSKGHDGRVIWNSCIHSRSYANIRPKVQTHTEYRLHYGMARALHAVRIG